MSNKNTTFSRGKKMLLDFANVFKAFVGTNYLAVSFAFSQSGLLLGSVGIVIIAVVIAHCCHLLVKCKREAIRQILQPAEQINSKPKKHDATAKNEDEQEVRVKHSISKARIKEQIEMHLSYGDVAWVAMGKWGLGIVNFALVVTQIGFCVGFTIFLGNTIQKMLPLTNSTISFPAATLTPGNQSDFFSENNDNNLHTDSSTVETSTTHANMTNSSALNPPLVAPPRPRYEVLIAAMTPIFIVFAFLRNVRKHLGPVSIAANIAVFLAYFAIMAYIIIDFEIEQSVKWVRWTTFPIFFGQLTYAYEGIGTIIPIESSMTGNRSLFAPFLYLSLTIFTAILASIGIMGYMKYGDATQQIIVWNLPAHSIIPYILNSVICLGVMLTLPLMNYPVIEILEDLIFAEGRIFGPSKPKGSDRITVQTDYQPLMNEEDDEIAAILKRLPVASSIPDSVSAWKRNLFRAIIVCAESGIAIAFKNEYAYFSAFVGAVGGTLLAFIIPCCIHLKLHGGRLPWLIIVKDIIVILFGIVGGVASVFASSVAIFGDI